MVPLRVLSRTDFAESSPSNSLSSSISFTSFRLRTLFLSLHSFSHPDPLFSMTSALFWQNTRGGIPLRKLLRCTEAQKCLFVSPLLATLTHSLSRKSFPCLSYANTRDGCASARPLHSSLPPSHAPRGASIPCALTRLRILPVATGAWGEWATEFPSLSRRQFTTRQRWPSPGAWRKRPATCRRFSLCSVRMLWSFNFRAIDRRHTPQLRLRPSKGFFSPALTVPFAMSSACLCLRRVLSALVCPP